MLTADPLDRRIRAIGHEIFGRAAKAEPSPLRQAWWQHRMLDWVMRDDVLKTQLFRFIEALPKLRGPRAVASHLKQYLRGGSRNGHALPSIVDLATAYGSDESLHARIMAMLARTGSLQMAGTFIAGQTADEAIVSVVKLRRANMTFTLDVLGETVLCAADADHVQQVYIDLINAMAAAAPAWRANPLLDDAPFGPLPRVNLSIKLSALAPRFDPIAADKVSDIVLDRLRPVLRLARQRGTFINVDLEHYAFKDITYSIFTRILMEPEFRDWQHAGIVVQAYLRDSEDQLRRLFDWARHRGTPITVRLVKGAYWDHETTLAIANRWPIPVWTEKWQSDRNYEKLGRILLENHEWTRPAFASHNVRSLAAVLAQAESLRLPPRLLEVQMLYGMGEPLKQALIAIGQRVRVYTPFGDLMPGMAYFMRRLLENTANEGFLRQSFSDGVPESVLLAEPAPRQSSAAAPLPKWTASGPDGEADMQVFENEPLSDFADAGTRAQLAAALGEEHAEARCLELIGGAAANGRALHTLINPSHPRQVTAKAALCDRADAERAVAAAADASQTWAAMSAAQRAERLNNAAARLRHRRAQLTALLIRVLGKTWRDADAEAAGMIDALAFAAQSIRRLDSMPRRRDVPGESNEVTWQPRGVTVVLTSASAPAAGALELVASALAAGNAVVWQPDIRTAPVAIDVVRVLHDAGILAGAVNVLFGDDDLAKALASHPMVSTVAVRGSREVVARVAAAAGTPSTHATARRVVALADGAAAIIVDDNTDIDEAVSGTLSSAFTYAGQGAAGVSHAVVVAGAYGAFVERLAATARELAVGPADDPATSIGPVLDHDRRTAIVHTVDALKKVAQCLVDRHCAKDPKPQGTCLIGPFVFAGAPHDFVPPTDCGGPILCVIRADDLPHAIALVNAIPQIASVGLFSRGPDHIANVKRGVRAARLFINRRVSAGAVGRQPVGGLPATGNVSAVGSADLLREFMDMRLVSENVLRHGLAPAEPAAAPEKPSRK